MRELDDWLDIIERFPYDAVVDEFHRAGKHFVPDELSRQLDDVRAAVRVLDCFLDTALDKWDQRYDYQTYLALDVLPLSSLDHDEDAVAAARQQDRLMVHLIADALRFELDVSDGVSTLLPEQRPAPDVVRLRYRHGVRAIRPALDRLGLAGALLDAGPEQVARRVCATVERDRSRAEERTMRLSNLPVYVSHDEYMFIRILQAFESTFALLAACLRSAVGALGVGDPPAATDRLTLAEARLHESARLFPLLATMQVEAFLIFRMYTEGASAIQSRNYKAVESLCRTPDAARLDSVAYRSVPDVRDRVLAGQATLDDAVRDAVASGLLDGESRAGVERAMSRFAGTLLRWRQSHYSMAMRMLGERTGTGYTEGTPYLKGVRKIPVFRYLGMERTTP